MYLNIRRLIVCASLLIGISGSISAQQVTSGIFGYYKLTLLGNSDTIVSIPFARLPAATVQVASAASNVVQFQGSPGWTPGQFVYASGTQSNTYYVRIESGALEGQYFDVNTNDASSLTLNLNGGSLTGLAANDQISVIPYWTFGTVFVNGNGIVPSTSLNVHNTEILLPSLTNSGINISAGSPYFYYTNSGTVVWRKQGSSITNRNDDKLPPNCYLIIRHKNVATNTTFISFGDVILTKVSIPLNVNSTNKQDNPIGLTRPLQVSLSDSKLVDSGAFIPSSSVTVHSDELYVFDNTATNFNKSAGTPYFYYTNATTAAWRHQGSSVDMSKSNIFLPGTGFIIRKVAATSSLLWSNTPTYTNN